MINVIEAQKQILGESSSLHPLSHKRVRLEQAVSHVLAKNITADRDYPPFDKATMDGFSIRIEDFSDFSKKGFHIAQENPAGTLSTTPILRGECSRIMTGAPLPPDADTVIRLEDIREESNRIFPNLDHIQKGSFIIQQGEEIKKDSILLRKNTHLQSSDISLMASLGLSKVFVYTPPSCAILSTGNEIIPISQTPKQEQIRDCNYHSLKVALSSYHIRTRFHDIVKDNKKSIQKGIEKALKNDIVILTGGVSVGNLDLVPTVLSEMGCRCIFHKVNVKPGKPIWFGRKENGSIIFALPGNPISVHVGFKIFIEPYIRSSLHLPPLPTVFLPLEENHSLKDSRTEYFLCRLNQNGKLSIQPTNSSGDIKRILGSSGIACHPSVHPVILKDFPVEYLSW